MQVENCKLLIRIFDNISSKDETKYHLCTMRMIPKDDNKVEVVATNGHILFKTLIDDEGLRQIIGANDVFIPNLDSMKLFKVQFKGWLTLNKRVDYYPHAKLDHCTYSKYPGVEQLIENNQTYKMPNKPQNKLTYGLNSDYIQSIAKTFDSEKLKFTFGLIDNLHAVTITSAEHNDSMALIMPLRV